MAWSETSNGLGMTANGLGMRLAMAWSETSNGLGMTANGLGMRLGIDQDGGRPGTMTVRYRYRNEKLGVAQRCDTKLCTCRGHLSCL